MSKAFSLDVQSVLKWVDNMTTADLVKSENTYAGAQLMQYHHDHKTYRVQ